MPLELADSRNHFRSTEGGQFDEEGFIRACINLIEPHAPGMPLIEYPFRLQPNQTYELDFIYNVGIPQATRIEVFYYATAQQADAVFEGRVLPQVNAITVNQPITIITPTVPVADATGLLDQEGHLRITTPALDNDPSMPDVYYGILALYQPDE